MVPQYFGYLEGQTIVPDKKYYQKRFLDVIYFEFQIDKSTWKPGNNSNKKEKYYNMIDDVILNAINSKRSEERRGI